MHKLEKYLEDGNESLDAFAARLETDVAALRAVLRGDVKAEVSLARRIAMETAGAVTFADMMADMDTSSAQIIDLTSIEAEGDIEIDADILKEAIRFTLHCMIVENTDQLPAIEMSEETLALAALAAANTHAAMARVTSRRGPARLAQALSPVLSETLTENGDLPISPPQLKAAAACIAAIYFLGLPLRPGQNP